MINIGNTNKIYLMCNNLKFCKFFDLKASTADDCYNMCSFVFRNNIPRINFRGLNLNFLPDYPTM
jgi:hypothetical protein